ncbi:hypothetical protein GXM_00927 [Nostoc sphaeroides CCNUC1]|uniref:Uncharacterized protein n=1 Tax=Nostoc sphaeroides CCNUC1 TaxID=2653204 RepID=A0A5P8VSZ7_9NOSO|nr:hypothetical protein GXM_00927 [Nostoc sphaeroides CCNUC1]
MGIGNWELGMGSSACVLVSLISPLLTDAMNRVSTRYIVWSRWALTN